MLNINSNVTAPVVEGDVFTNVAAENFKVEYFDENRILHDVLTKAFEAYDIPIDFNNFVVQEPVKPMVPAWLR